MDGEEVSKVEGETRRRRKGKGKERGENPARNRQQNNFLPSSSLSGSQIRTEVSKARWVEEIGMAQVIEKNGSLWATTGVIRNGNLYCHIEEIGYLAQIGALVLLDEGDNVMGLKDIFTKCADRRYGCTWEFFEAYRDLKSLGFIVGRHSQPWSLKHDNLKPNSNFTVDTDFIADRIEELQIGAANLIFDIYKPNSKFKKTDPGAPSFIICLVGDWPPIRKEVEYLEEKCKLVPLKFCHVNHGDVRFFSFPEVSLPVLP
ncbi:tRNA-splicing endonuclease subunit [Rhynchospora pubera]|uniref:tRNA-splicing endonuclease subunit n=1 Tax=Rhynchospora pubera TaxID=906938 RepID=A0AAV8E106_9POAL|nr:tRNA-splicing endonuclease subunit [Rhynchospora pubera]